MNATIPCKAGETARGWVLYDGECSLCTSAALRFQNVLRRSGFEPASLQTPWVCARLGLHFDTTPDEMMILLPDGRTFGGADGIVQIARRVWWAWPLFTLAQIPGTMILLRAIYRRVASKRRCLNGVCGEKTRARHHGVTTFFEMP